MINNLYLNVGAMKAGTTWLYAHLEHHADIHFSREKEIHFFSHINSYRTPLNDSGRLNRFKAAMGQLNDGQPSLHDATRLVDWYRHYLAGPVDDTWYENLFSERSSQRYMADFSNLNSHLSDVGWNHVKSLTHNLKVTYILRHPMERLWSHIKFHTKIMGEYEEMLKWDEAQFKKMVERAFIWDNVEYSRTLESLARNLNEDQYRVYFFENIHAKPLESLRDIEDFLQIGRHSYNPEKLEERVNVSTPLALPASFEDQFKDRLRKEARNVANLGYELPESWNTLLDDAAAE